LFEDYSPQDLLIIAENLLKHEGLKASPAAQEHIRMYLTALYDKRDKHFGNARTVRQLAGEVIKKQNLRLASMEASKRNEEELSTLNFDDVKHLEISKTETKQTLGFRLGGK